MANRMFCTNSMQSDRACNCCHEGRIHQQSLSVGRINRPTKKSHMQDNACNNGLPRCYCAYTRQQSKQYLLLERIEQRHPHVWHILQSPVWTRQASVNHATIGSRKPNDKNETCTKNHNHAHERKTWKKAATSIPRLLHSKLCVDLLDIASDTSGDSHDTSASIQGDSDAHRSFRIAHHHHLHQPTPRLKQRDPPMPAQAPRTSPTSAPRHRVKQREAHSPSSRACSAEARAREGREQLREVRERLRCFGRGRLREAR